MISLNLLSQEKKNEVSKHIILISVQYIFALSFILICTAGAALLVAKLIVQNGFFQAVRQNALVTKEYSTLNQNVREVNQKIGQLKSVQNSFSIWSTKLAAVASLTPKNVELYTMNISSETKSAQFIGRAATRDDLLLYKTNLEKSGLFTDISLPIEYLLNANDVYFDIKAKIAL